MVVVAKKMAVDEKALVQYVEKLDDKNLEAMEDEEVSLVDGVFKSAFEALGEETWYCGDGFVVSSCVRSINNLFGGTMLTFDLLEEVA
nr:hypothetical protein [Tanacetum cinerariifolium]